MSVIHGTKSKTDVLPSLDLRFSYRKDLVDTMSGKNLIDFSRVQSGTSKSTYFGADGLLKYADANEPRFDHDPTTGESLGLLVEEQRVNYFLRSEALSTSPWTASNVIAVPYTALSPSGTFTANTLDATGANGTVTQSVATTAVQMTFSIYLKRKSGTGNIDITADGTTWVTQTINDTTWTRCVVTQTAVNGTSNPGIRISTSNDKIYAWGGQYE